MPSHPRDPNRDEKGRLLPGHAVLQNAGRPKRIEVEKMNAAIVAVTDEKTMRAWVRAMQNKLAEGDKWATNFVFDRTLGKVEDAGQLRTSGNVQINVVWSSGSNDKSVEFDVIDGEAAALPDRGTAGTAYDAEGVYRFAGEEEGDSGG